MRLAPKMDCPCCESSMSRVLTINNQKDRMTEDGRPRRLRQCVHCGSVWSTTENFEHLVKKHNTLGNSPAR